MNAALLQSIGLALSTFVQEDAPTIVAALLVSAGKLDWRWAFAACFLGIWIGDALLYLLTRGAGRPLLATKLAQRFVKPESLARGEAWFVQRGTWALVASRFVPGLRLPKYLAAGFLRVAFPKFLVATGAAVLVWNTALFLVAHWLEGKAQSVVQNSAGTFSMAGAILFVGILSWRKGVRLVAASPKRPLPIPTPYAARGQRAHSKRRCGWRAGCTGNTGPHGCSTFRSR